jgi:hypothetical protein
MRLDSRVGMPGSEFRTLQTRDRIGAAHVC